MKGTILLIFYFVFSLSFSQPYLPLLDEDVVWSVDFNFEPFGGGPSGIITYQITVGEETMINGNLYKRVFQNGIGNSCYVREENGRVFRYDEGNNTDVVLYDFNLGIGDIYVVPDIMMSEFCAYSGNWYFGPLDMEVIDVYTDFIAGENRKVLEFQYEGKIEPTLWIEGIGSTHGFDPVGTSWDIGHTYLVCYTKDGVTTFFNNATACDNTTLGLSDEYLDQIVLAPNPIVDRAILQLPGSAFIDQVRILDVSGRLIEEFSVNKDYLVLDAMQFRSGLYFYQAISGNSIIKTERFIVR